MMMQFSGDLGMMILGLVTAVCGFPTSVTSITLSQDACPDLLYV